MCLFCSFDIAADHEKDTAKVEFTNGKVSLRPCLWAKILSTQIDFEYSNGVCKRVPANFSCQKFLHTRQEKILHTPFEDPL